MSLKHRPKELAHEFPHAYGLEVSILERIITKAMNEMNEACAEQMESVGDTSAARVIRELKIEVKE
jgi:hypothetical protein